MKKFISTMMAILMVFAVGLTNVGCKRESGLEEIDETKTQLYVSYLDQGVGREYIEAIGRQFEIDFAEKSFEEGKTGVQVLYNPNTDINAASFYESSIEGDEYNVYFTEYINYKQWASKFMDVTDIMENPAITGYNAQTGEYTRETKAIKDKVDPVLLEFLNVSNGTTKEYRGLPFYLAIKSVNYNADLWNEKGFYIYGAPSDYVAYAIKDNTDLDVAIADYNAAIEPVNKGTKTLRFGNANGQIKVGNEFVSANGYSLSAGPDGKFGTFDDGFPATFDEFYALCNYIVSNNVTPFIWTGANAGYADMLTQSIFTNDLGLERAKTYYTLNGTMDNLVKFVDGKAQFDSNGNPIIDAPYTFNGGASDGYEMMRTVSKYYALQFAQKVATTPSWTHSACYDSTSQSEAQNKYLTEGFTKTGNPTAMLMDGAWWQAEANATFESMKIDNIKWAKENRNFGVMALPYANIETYASKVQNGEKNLIVTENDSVCFINKNIDENSPQYEVSKVFMSYFNSDDMAGLFTAKTNMLRAIDVDLTTNKYYDQISPYGKSFVDYKNGVDIMFPYTTNKLMNNNRGYFANTRDGWQFQAYSQTMGEQWKVIDTIHTYFASKGIDAKHYYEAIYNYFKTVAWPQLKIS